jgi:hypothetical protein
MYAENLSLYLDKSEAETVEIMKSVLKEDCSPHGTIFEWYNIS